MFRHARTWGLLDVSKVEKLRSAMTGIHILSLSDTPSPEWIYSYLVASRWLQQPQASHKDTATQGSKKRL